MLVREPLRLGIEILDDAECLVVLVGSVSVPLAPLFVQVVDQGDEPPVVVPGAPDPDGTRVVGVRRLVTCPAAADMVGRAKHLHGLEQHLVYVLVAVELCSFLRVMR